MRTSRRTGGFTLVELMVSMSLFLVLGTALVALLTNAFEFLRSGTAGSEVADMAGEYLRFRPETLGGPLGQAEHKAGRFHYAEAGLRLCP